MPKNKIMNDKVLERYQDVVVEYKDNCYSLFNNTNLFKVKSKIVPIHSSPQTLGNSILVEETDTLITFKIYDVSAEVEGDGLVLSKEVMGEIVFDKNQQKSTGEKINLETFLALDDASISCLLLGIDEIIKINTNVFDFLNKSSKKFQEIILNDIAYLNFVNLCIFNILEFEKLVNSKNTKLLETNLKNEGFELNEANKLHQVVGLPKFAIKMIKQNKLESYIEKLKDISSIMDGNSFKIFLDFLGNSKLISNYKSYYTPVGFDSFLDNVEVLIKKDYRVVDLLNYLLKQSMYYNDLHEFHFPSKESMLLKDYVEMCENFGLKYEKYPSGLRKTHDIVAKNINSLQEVSIEIDDKFEESTIKYFEVEMELEIKDPKDPKIKKTYIFSVPSSVRDLIQEGNDLHHCVGSYANKIMNGESCIVFMRDAETPNVSFITLDINKKYELLEAKKNFNEEPEPEYYKIIEKWLERVKRKVR